MTFLIPDISKGKTVSYSMGGGTDGGGGDGGSPKTGILPKGSMILALPP